VRPTIGLSWSKRWLGPPRLVMNLAAPHSITSSASNCIELGTSRPKRTYPDIVNRSRLSRLRHSLTGCVYRELHPY
jgi:hypothetical protein